MSGPVLVIGAGVWVLCQVFGGNALGRLNLFGSTGGGDEPEVMRGYREPGFKGKRVR